MKSNEKFSTVPVRTFFIPFYFGSGMIIPFPDPHRPKSSESGSGIHITAKKYLFSDNSDSEQKDVCGSTVLIDSDGSSNASTVLYTPSTQDDMDIEVVSEHINVKIVKENIQKGDCVDQITIKTPNPKGRLFFKIDL